MSDNTLSSTLLQVLETVPSAKRYFIALSGGLDSIALLHFFRLLHPNLTIHAIHVHHGLSANADAWAAHCEAVCQVLNVSCHIERVRLELDGEGVEAAARKARYQVFESILQEGDVLLQGHHMNDQAETVLMRALRGAVQKACLQYQLLAC